MFAIAPKNNKAIQTLLAQVAGIISNQIFI